MSTQYLENFLNVAVTWINEMQGGVPRSYCGNSGMKTKGTRMTADTTGTRELGLGASG